MSKYLEEAAHSVMSTSESEQSLSERTAVCPPNRALIFMKHNSSDYEETEERQGDEAGDGDGDLYDDDIGDFDCDISPVMTSSGKFNKNYFTIDYTDNEIPAGNNNNHQDLNSSLSQDEDILDTTIVPSNSAKKSLMKLFSPEKLPLRNIEMSSLEEKLSPMDVSDVSSPDSQKSLSEEVTQSMSSFSLSEDSLTYIVDCRAKPEEDSLDEISSGEISSSSERDSHVSQNISDFWDEERYLSEYNYDEPLDEDRAKNLLNFGDDYRNYIDSLSESYSSISSISVDRRRRSKRMRKKTVLLPGPHYDTQSEAEGDNLSSVLQDSEREICRVATSLDTCQYGGGFVKPDCYNQYTDLMRLCQDNLTILIDCLSSARLQDTFVSKKKSRDLRVLLNKWEKLLSKIKENIQHSEVYESLKSDVMSLRRDLVLVLEEREKDEDIEDDAELEQKLHTFRQAMSQLCDFKSQLFNLNLSVHNFLASLHASTGPDQRFTTATHLKEEVVELYQLWDRAHHTTVGNITRTEDLLAKLRLFETEVVQLRSLLSQDKRRRTGGRDGGSWSGDSGISDDSGGDGWLTDSDERLSQLRAIADSLRRNLPPDSPSINIIERTLQSTQAQLQDLQDLQRRQARPAGRTCPGLKHRLKARPGERASELASPLTTASTRRRRKVVKVAIVINLLLFLLAFLCWLAQPACCENYNSLYLLPKLTYVNGPPPI